MNSFKNILIAFAVICIASFTSCSSEDDLNTVPVTSFSDLSVFENLSRVDQQVNGLYATAKNGNVLGGRFFVYNEVRAENFINETNNNVTAFSVWNHTTQATNVNDVTNLWNTSYLGINRINVFLVGIDANTQKLKDLGVSDETMNGFRGEARFLRGLLYKNLLMLYARPFADGAGARPGLPLQLSGNVASGENRLARSTVAQVYTQILEDLNFAEANLPAIRATPFLSTTRAIKSAAIAMKVRVFLHMQRYPDVVTEANKLVSIAAPFRSSTAIPHALAPTVTVAFSTPYTNVERIFNMPFNENDLPGTQNGLGSYFNPNPRGIGDFSMNRLGLVADTVNWRNGDDRRAFIFLNASNNKIYWNKFPTGPQHLDFVPVIRYAEVLLSLAESLARTGNTTRSLEILNAVRTRARGIAFAAFPTQNDLIEAILKEREIEFLGEGFRSPDLLRLLRPLPAKGGITAIPATSTGYIWPIPQGELLINKAMEQNPGY